MKTLLVFLLLLFLSLGYSIETLAAATSAATEYASSRFFAVPPGYFHFLSPPAVPSPVIRPRQPPPSPHNHHGKSPAPAPPTPHAHRSRPPSPVYYTSPPSTPHGHHQRSPPPVYHRSPPPTPHSHHPRPPSPVYYRSPPSPVYYRSPPAAPHVHHPRAPPRVYYGPPSPIYKRSPPPTPYRGPSPVYHPPPPSPHRGPSPVYHSPPPSPHRGHTPVYHPPPPSPHHHKHRGSVPPPPMYYRSPPPPSPHHHHRHQSVPPPPVDYTSPPPQHHQHHPRSPPVQSYYPPVGRSLSPCYYSPPPKKPAAYEMEGMKLVIQGRVVLNRGNVTTELKGAMVKVLCLMSSNEVKESYGRTDIQGRFRVMVNGLEVGKVEIQTCGAAVKYEDSRGFVRSGNDLGFRSMTTKEIVLEAGDVVY